MWKHFWKRRVQNWQNTNFAKFKTFHRVCECNLIFFRFQRWITKCYVSQRTPCDFQDKDLAIEASIVHRCAFYQRRSANRIGDRSSYALLFATFAEWAQHDLSLHRRDIYGTGESVILVAIRPSSTICFRKRVVNQDGHRWSTIANISLACCRGSPLANDGFKRDKFQWLCRYIFLQLFVTQLQR